MMFYTFNNLPKCMINIETVEKIVFERFHAYGSPDNLQYDTKEFNYYDQIAHLLMSIIAIDFPNFKDTFISGEIKIFKEKLKGQNYLDVKKELCALLQYLNNFSQSEDVRKLKFIQINQLQLVKSIVSTVLSKSSHVFKKSHLKDCRKLKLTLPFTCLLKLVAKRKVEVKNGKVSLSCGEWDKILEVVFEYLLWLEVTLMENCKQFQKGIYELEDDRIRQIIFRFTNFLKGTLASERRIVNLGELDEESQFFPPCMASLHQTLRLTHRLSYMSRYQYTLFLKDIGLPLDDNILLWKTEYSKPHVGSTCTHEWDEKEKRYMYQIQHLYGLMGSQTNKTSHSCEKFIEDLQSKMDGGCPFQHLTNENLKKAIPEKLMSLPDVEDIFEYKNCNLPQKACAAYLKCQKKSLTRQNLNFNCNNINSSKIHYMISPLQYYFAAKSLCS